MKMLLVVQDTRFKTFPKNKTAHLLGVDWQIHADITAALRVGGRTARRFGNPR
jgi:hypothetical protein